MPHHPYVPNDDEHRRPPAPPAEWLRRLALNRRHFLRVGLGGLGLGLAGAACTSAPEPPKPSGSSPETAASMPPRTPETSAPAAETAGSEASPVAGSAASSAGPKLGEPILVVVQLSGGNDGLRTVVPYTDDNYYQNRPTLAIPSESALPLNDRIGFHPNLAHFKAIYDAGHLALLQGVGYPSPSRSHFRSMDIWHTAEPVELVNYGWLGRYMDLVLRDTSTPFKAINVGNATPKALWAKATPAAGIRDINAFQLRTNLRFNDDRAALLKAFERINARTGGDAVFEFINRNWSATSEGAKLLQAATGQYRSSVNYPQNPFANSLRFIAELIQADLGTRVFYTSLGGFDDHAGEKNVHDRLMSQFGDGLAAFYQDLKEMGQLDRVLVLTFSEFGRRVKENASAGTDHGAAQPLFVIGGRVKGGIYGAHPSLSTLDDGDLKYGIDFRAVYHTILTDWLRADGRAILGAAHESIGFVRT